MPASALLAFQFLSLLWVVEMQETVRSFPVAGVSRLGIKGQKKGGFAQGRNSDYLTDHLSMSLGLALYWEIPAAWEERERCEWKLRAEEERTRITSRQPDSGTH